MDGEKKRKRGEDIETREEEKRPRTWQDELYNNYLNAHAQRDPATRYEPKGVFLVSAHGFESKVDLRGNMINTPIIEKIKKDYPYYYDNMSWLARNRKLTPGQQWDDAIIDLMANTNIGAVVGLGTLALMMPGTDQVCSTSQADINIVNDVYKGFYAKYPNIPPNSYIENGLFTLSRRKLREQLYNTYNQSIRDRDRSAPAQHFFNDMNEGKIWKHVKLDPNHNKTYAFYALEGEPASLACNYGLHIISIIMQNNEGLYNRIFPVPNISSNIDARATRQRLDQYVDALYFDDKDQYSRICRGTYSSIMLRIENSVNGSQYIYTSDLIMLGVILQLKEMFIFDPSCRPVKRAGVTPITLRSGEVVHRELVTGSALKEYEYECDYSPPPVGVPSPRQEARVFQPPFPGFASGPPSYPKEEEKMVEENKGWLSGWWRGGGNRLTKHRRRNKMTRHTKRKITRTKRKRHIHTKRKHNNNNKRSTR
jgi:hypothetical protein